MSKKLILAVDDEEDILELIDYNLKKEGYEVILARSGNEALKTIQTNMPDLILLDLMLPDIDGFDICKIVKNNSKTAHIPIIMLTAKGEDADIVSGLELGASDYVVKPFSHRVLLARIRAILRQKTSVVRDTAKTIKIHNMTVNPGRFEVHVGNSLIPLTATEFNILHFLARHPGWVFTRSQIIDSIKSEEYSVTDRAVDVQIMGLRRKLHTAGKYIETIRGVGYRFKE